MSGGRFPKVLRFFTGHVLDEKRPETGIDEFLLEYASHLFQHEAFHLAHILQALLSSLPLANLTLYPDLLEQPTHLSRPYIRRTSPFRSIFCLLGPVTPNSSQRVLRAQEAEVYPLSDI